MKKTLSFALSMLMLNFFSFTTLASETPREKARNTMLAAEVKAGVAAIGTGKSARVRVLHQR